MTEALSKVDGDALAAEFERYLRRAGSGFRGTDAGSRPKRHSHSPRRRAAG